MKDFLKINKRPAPLPPLILDPRVYPVLLFQINPINPKALTLTLICEVIYPSIKTDRQIEVAIRKIERPKKVTLSPPIYTCFICSCFNHLHSSFRLEVPASYMFENLKNVNMYITREISDVKTIGLF